MQWLSWEKKEDFLWDTIYVVGLLEHLFKNEMRENESRSKTVRLHINKLSNWQRKLYAEDL